MRRLIGEVSDIVVHELDRANEVHDPLFHSGHEAFGVIGEELWEVTECFKDVSKAFEKFREGVFNDYEKQMEEELMEIHRNAILCACEMIQVSAMALKGLNSIGGRK